MVLFAQKDVAIKYLEDGTAVIKDLETRTIYTSLSATYDAKNRIGLPKSLKMPINNAYSVLMNAYNKAYDQTAEDLFKICENLLTKIEDKSESDPIREYCVLNKDNKIIVIDKDVCFFIKFSFS